MEAIKFTCIVHSGGFDREGEFKLVLKIPSAELPELLKTALLLEKLVSVEMKETI